MAIISGARVDEPVADELVAWLLCKESVAGLRGHHLLVGEVPVPKRRDRELRDQVQGVVHTGQQRAPRGIRLKVDSVTKAWFREPHRPFVRVSVLAKHGTVQCYFVAI